MTYGEQESSCRVQWNTDEGICLENTGLEQFPVTDPEEGRNWTIGERSPGKCCLLQRAQEGAGEKGLKKD